ncbi:MAG: ATP-dependent zinc metalloprotease FtsH [Actinomycetaceae bacterium]|nr:ATP-dependent zinc metalloprotease FtsH [Actinomycetaceae bacterium]MDY6083205.1 ATP-dependent zinc metalloprotease FtsH [Actinomycetaceae bacterium]
METADRKGNSKPVRDPVTKENAHPWRTEGLPEIPDPRNKSRQPKQRPAWWKIAIVVILGWVILYFAFTQVMNQIHPVVDLPYNKFYQQLENNNVQVIKPRGDTIEGQLKKEQTYKDVTFKDFTTERPSWAVDAMPRLLQDDDVEISAESPISRTNPIISMLLSVIPIALILLAWWWIVRSQMSGSAGGLFGFKEHKPVSPEKNRVTFDDVAGIDEVKDQLHEVVDMLRDPDKYTRLGAKIPRGILLEGAPGTGKTLLARATAGEADVPFFSVSASEIGGILAGKGASDVRGLFDAARKVAPAIVFIDEIDAIGRSRSSQISLTTDTDREQTLNQILTEMDGFTSSDNIIVIAATNLAEVLDSALTRAGRFDRTITVSAPDQVGREAILKVHTREHPLGPDVSLQAVAQSTPGLTGADLANLVNEASLLAARNHEESISMADFTNALETIQLGVKRAVVMDEEERTRTAWHEAGHAILGMIQPGADPVRKISIIPRGRALGVTLSTPDSDKYGYDKAYLRGRIIGALGGMAAEQEIFGVVTTGAESDLQNATGIARQMFGRWGMSEKIGPVQVYPNEGDPRSSGASESLLAAVDDEVRTLMTECYAEARRLLNVHHEQHKALAMALLDRETLGEDEAYQIAGIQRKKNDEHLVGAHHEGADNRPVVLES